MIKWNSNCSNQSSYVIYNPNNKRNIREVFGFYYLIQTKYNQQNRLYHQNYEKQNPKYLIISRNDQENTLLYLENQIKNQNEVRQQLQNQIQNLLTDIQQQFTNNDYLISMLINSKKNEVLIKNKIEVKEIKQDDSNKQRFSYELVKESGKKQSKICHAFTFNTEDNILIVGCQEKILIYKFIDGKIGEEEQILTNHKNYVDCLFYIKKSNRFISGSKDQSIIVWKRDDNNLWIIDQILVGHKDFINCLLMNQNEDLLISCSDEGTLKFWTKESDEWNCQQKIKTRHSIYAISMNQTENMIITCGDGIKLNVLEKQDDLQWIKKQKINVEESGKRLCFTFKNQFIFQPDTKDYLEVYDLDKNINQFQKLQQIQIQSCKKCFKFFPCQLVDQLNILLVKHGEFLNIFELTQNKEYKLKQTIKYESISLYGTISNDGQYLISYHKGLEDIQVRRLNLIND